VCLQELLRRSVPVSPRLRAVREVAQVAEHTGIIVKCSVLADIVAPVCRVRTHVSKDPRENLGRQAVNVIVANDFWVKDVSVCLFVFLELGARSEMFEEPHDASREGSAVGSIELQYD
jgi:hypothetical protein